MAGMNSPAGGPGPEPIDDEQSVAILDAARRLLAHEGAGALTIRRIAAEAGWSTMGVYSRYGSKDGIVDRLYADGFAELARRMRAVPHSDDPLHDLLRLGLVYRETALANATSYEVMFHDVIPGFTPSPASAEIASGVLADLVERVERAVAAGVLTDHGASRMALALWSVAHGFVSLEIHARQTDDDPVHAAGPDRDRIYRLACESLLRGLCAPRTTTTGTTTTGTTPSTDGTPA